MRQEDVLVHRHGHRRHRYFRRDGWVFRLIPASSHLSAVALVSTVHFQVVLEIPGVERLRDVAACWRAGLEAHLAEDSRLGVVRSDERGRQELHAWAVAVLRALVWEQVAPVPLDSRGLWVEDAPAERSAVGCWLRCQGALRVRCLWVEREQVSVWLR